MYKKHVKWLSGLLVLMVLLPCLSVMAAAEDMVERWRMHEITFTSQTVYADPFNEAVLDVTFTGPGGAEMVMPGFWDGGAVWRVRFAPMEAGLWSWETKCSNTADAGLHGLTGQFTCVPYTGALDIYRRGFVKTVPGTRYFVYGDGTPFFYLGDTHWSMPGEPFETMFKTVVDTRAQQGFTVYQSEPLGIGHSDNGPGFNLRDGLGESDLAAFADLDRRFGYIAGAGLVHANAQFFYASELAEHDYGEAYLRKLGRYWVARYGAYPVLWTTAQEADDDFYDVFKAESNPWKIVAGAVGASDPYHHPLSAHMENTGSTRASNSEFKKLPAHSWFAAQTSPALNDIYPRTKIGGSFEVVKDFWDNGGGKPAILYEGRYENLWTKNFGARVQGWYAFLNGLYGHGYGAIDLWLHKSAYDIGTTSKDGIDTITPADKAVPWTESLYFDTASQLGGHMKSFLQGMEWWRLTPRFGSWKWCIPWQLTFLRGARYAVATIGSDTYVAYFYNTNRATGILRGLDSGPYRAEWFNPRTGESVGIGEVCPFLGMYFVPCKPDAQDWVLYLCRG